MGSMILELAFKSIDVQKRRYANGRKVERAKDIVKKYQMECEPKSSQYVRYGDAIKALRKLMLDIRRKDILTEDVEKSIYEIFHKCGLKRIIEEENKKKAERENNQGCQRPMQWAHHYGR